MYCTVTNQTNNLNVRHEISNEVYTRSINIPKTNAARSTPSSMHLVSCKLLPLGGLDSTLEFHLPPAPNLPASPPLVTEPWMSQVHDPRSSLIGYKQW
jgi:hypothetical protein